MFKYIGLVALAAVSTPAWHLVKLLSFASAAQSPIQGMVS